MEHRTCQNNTGEVVSGRNAGFGLPSGQIRSVCMGVTVIFF